MIINITDYDPKKFQQAMHWMNDNICNCYIDAEGDIVVDADTWRVYKRQNSIEGFWETTWLLEFDNDSDATAFLMRWA
jgi:hypothetical protein